MNAANLVSQWNTVSFTPTTTTLTITPPAGYTLSDIPHGQSVTIGVSVSPSASTGDVSLLGGPAGYNASCTSTPCNLGIDFATLSGGTASGSTTLLPGGTYDVTARYAGDGTHAASTSCAVKVTVAAENSNTILYWGLEIAAGMSPMSPQGLSPMGTPSVVAARPDAYRLYRDCGQRTLVIQTPY